MESELQIEARQFRGLNGYCGFQQFRIYQLRFTRLGDGQVAIAPGHAPGQERVVVPAQRFEQWWVSEK